MRLLSLVLLALHGVQAAFIRRLECDLADIPSSPINPVFQPLSLSGGLDESNVLFLKLSGDYPGPDGCELLNGAIAKVLVDVKVLGRTVGYQIESNGSCPTVSPIGHLRSDTRTYTNYESSYSLDGAYQLHTLATTIRLQLNNGSDAACVAAHITPDIGPLASNLLKSLPLAIMLISGIIAAGIRIYRNRGSGIFRYEIANSANDPAESFFPGMGSCLQYIQFVFMTGCLTLSYPGFFKPIVSQLAWSSLYYANGPITHEFTYPGIGDGIYTMNGTYGLELMAQTLGATTVGDLWINSTINLAVMLVGIVAVIQYATLVKWMRNILPFWKTPGGVDLRAEFLTRIQHTGWSVLRTVLQYYLLPIVTFSLYQPLMATFFPVYRTFLAIMLVALLTVTLGLVVRYLGIQNRQQIFFADSSLSKQTTRSWLLDALHGLPLIQGVAIGGLQISGVGQIIILAACEIFLIIVLALHHRRDTSLWKPVAFPAVRLTTILISCAFLPTAGLSEGTKGYLGYSILFLHAAALLFGFLATAVVDLARLVLGTADPAGRPDSTPVFGLDQLSRRSKRRTTFGELPALSPGDQPITAYIPHSSFRASSLEGSAATANTESHYFYRPPRHNHTSSSPTDDRSRATMQSIPSSPSSSTPSSEIDRESHSPSMELADMDVEIDKPSDVDYSVREADQYYRHAAARTIVMGSPNPRQDAPSRPTGSGASLSRSMQRKGKKEKRFEVVRSRPSSE
ncbi:hypothetical protein SI65_09344 [Aspergillus cristatus]|uniref:TRP C-terminal domain-containing protein n=1 Tax=Aspergillus cristatus TaxID=573508 RepID=A0A1E3B2C3_ASPCR|nr:hypothetical protein SI65_09344 [Aspergillus cristatus]